MNNSKLFALNWVVLSLALLGFYLAFFHVCMLLGYQAQVGLGVACWLVWFLSCKKFRHVFLNRFEYLIHQVVGIDVLLEGFNPFHDGYGFYWCAISFWIVLVGYRCVSVSMQKVDTVSKS